MRVPHTIDKNAVLAYEPSPESLELIGENERKIIAEDFQWNKDHCPTLVDFCVEAICNQFEAKPLLDELPCVDREHLLEILSTDLPLETCIPLINDDFYWHRRYEEKFGKIIIRKPTYWTWKSLYIERHIQGLIEQAQPQYNDEEAFDEILNMCCPYVSRVMVTQLQAWKPPLTMDKEDIPEVYPIDHISFIPIFRKLPQIVEFDLVFGMNEVSEDFNWKMFKVSVADCQRLGKAILDLKQLRILRIHRSKLEYKHCQALMQNLIKNRCLVHLDLSNCQIGDEGTLCVAKVLGVHPSLRHLILSNNMIGTRGAEALGFTLLSPQCAQLESLDLRLNPLRKEGAMGIMRALVRCCIPKELCMSGCLFEDDTPVKISQTLKINDSLIKLDISNNWFGEEGGEVVFLYIFFTDNPFLLEYLIRFRSITK